MLSLLLGPDEFGKKQYIDVLAKTTKSEAEFFSDAENSPAAENLASQDLFSKPKIFALKGLLSNYNQPEIIAKFISSRNYIVIVEEKLDKRISANKELLKNQSITVKEFILPHGLELDKWIVNRVKELGSGISPKAAGLLAEALGRDDSKETKVGGKVVAVEELYNLWQADGEIKKLLALALGREINEADVLDLSPQNREVDVFDLTNAIAENQKQKALSLMHNFLFSQTGADEKGAVIQLNGLLSEQFRNTLMVQDFLAAKKNENEILSLTGWKSGRLFVMKKIAGRFSQKKVLELLNKLAALDEELKTSSTPPRVLLDLIMSQFLA